MEMEPVRQLIHDYRSCWEDVIRGAQPLSALDRFFHVPCFMVAIDGTMTLYASQPEITAFNQ